jgi:hypothetical protein
MVAEETLVPIFQETHADSIISLRLRGVPWGCMRARLNSWRIGGCDLNALAQKWVCGIDSWREAANRRREEHDAILWQEPIN